MNLSEHLDILGHDVNALAFRTKVDEAVIRRALQGLPITEEDARKIQKYIGVHFGHDHHTADEYKINGLVTIAAPRAKGPGKDTRTNGALARAIDGNRARRF